MTTSALWASVSFRLTFLMVPAASPACRRVRLVRLRRARAARLARRRLRVLLCDDLLLHRGDDRIGPAARDRRGVERLADHFDRVLAQRKTEPARRHGPSVWRPTICRATVSISEPRSARAS